MGIFKEGVTVEFLNKWSRNTLAEQIGIEFINIGEDYLEARMPVDKRTHQPRKMMSESRTYLLAAVKTNTKAFVCEP